MTPENDVEPQDDSTPEGDNPEQNAESAATESSGSSDSAENAPTGEDFDPKDPLAFITGAAANGAVEDPDLSEVSVEVLQEKLKQAEDLANEHWDRLLRMQAEHDNQSKRAEKKVADAHKFALEAMINDLLPVKDSLEMGISAAQGEEADLEKIVEGSELTLKMLEQAFEKYHIVEINPVDQKFDPEFHQAMSMQEIEGKEPNTVASVFQKGYTLNERLIRPALVMVAK